MYAALTVTTKNKTNQNNARVNFMNMTYPVAVTEIE
ncbi:MAG: hypothetical protein JWM90_2965 [Thermoleophilia bacterium]|nr:hypothetical protein [Thermoleophilia bacterium]